MAITHNLASISNNLSGFDPVIDVIEGSSIGRSWLLWKLFEGLSAFDPNIKKITDSAPTPTFLRSEVGSNLQVEPVLNRAVLNDSIKFYMTNDPGLTKSPPSAIIYELLITHLGNGLCTVRVHHKIEGGTTYSPVGSNLILDATISLSERNLCLYSFTNTTQEKSAIHKFIFWKSSNANLVMAIDKWNQAYKGYLAWHNPTFTGYRHNVGSITEGLDHRSTIFTNANNGFTFIEGIGRHFYADLSTLGADLSPLCSGGTMPTGLFTFGAANNLIAGKLRFAVKKDSEFKVISNEIEGILLANPSAANYLAGQIYKYNTKFYLHGNNMSDGRVNYKVLFELG
ncbi:MAG: hypothetical protein AB1432_05450 [Bacteroidota bacterium]